MSVTFYHQHSNSTVNHASTINQQLTIIKHRKTILYCKEYTQRNIHCFENFPSQTITFKRRHTITLVPKQQRYISGKSLVRDPTADVRNNPVADFMFNVPVKFQKSILIFRVKTLCNPEQTAKKSCSHHFEEFVFKETRRFFFFH